MNEATNGGPKVYGDVCLRRVRRKRQKLLVKDLFLDYAKNSTLHGLRYITEKTLTTVEKWFWIATFILSVCLCSHQIIKVYKKWQDSPVIVTVSERFVSAGEVPFPSVTICPQIKTKASVYNFSEKIYQYNKYRNLTESEEDMLADIAIVCNSANLYFDPKIKRNFTNATIIENIRSVAENQSIIYGCIWRGNILTKCDVFHTVYTSEGLCFNINSLAADELFRDTVQNDYRYIESNEPAKGWSLTGGYVYDEGEFPVRGSENGAYPDLRVVLQSSDTDKDVRCNGLTSGYKIYIQHPTDFPQASMYYYAAVHGQVSSLAVSFNQIGTSEALENGYSSEERQCFFPKDRDLYYFKIYTMKNCRAECLSNYTYRMCKCVGYYMPHNTSSEICAEEKLQCMKDAHYKMASEEIKLELAKRKNGCNCLPACNTIEYEAEILKTDFNAKDYLKDLRSFYNISDDDVDDSVKYSSIEMYFKKPRFVCMRRSEIFGLTDFLANIGGLLGVFLGFSFLSLVEVLYFASLRVGFSLKHDLKEEKKKSQSVKYNNKY